MNEIDRIFSNWQKRNDEIFANLKTKTDEIFAEAHRKIVRIFLIFGVVVVVIGIACQIAIWG